VFRAPQARLAARFSGSLIVEIQDGRPSFVAPWNAIRFIADPSDHIIDVLAGEEGRLDIISQVVYGRDDLWWAIAAANDIINIFREPFAGDRIRIPDISRVLRAFGQVGTGTEISRFKP